MCACLQILSAEWGNGLALFVRSELSLSDREYEKLRLAFCKKYNASTDRWHKRIWYRCPVTGKELFMPQPLVSKYKWLPEWRKALEPFGIALSADGKVSERSLRRTAAQLIVQERALLEDPAREMGFLCFGIDGTAISGKRKFSHAMVSLGGMYAKGKVTLTEMKGATLLIGQHHDDALGLTAMLTRKPKTTGKDGKDVGSLCQEINEIYVQQEIALPDGEKYPCGIRGCFDLAAARGMRACRGKVACLCACQGQQGRQQMPGDGTVPEIPDGDSLAVWKRVQTTILQKHCAYGTEKMSRQSVRMASHYPYESWVPLRDGPWRCTHCGPGVNGKGVIVWRSWDEVHAEVARMAQLLEKAKQGDRAAEKERAAKYKEHAAAHLDNMYLTPQVGIESMLPGPLCHFLACITYSACVFWCAGT